MELLKPSLNQITNTIEHLKRDKAVSAKFDLDNYNHIFECLERLSLKQYQYLHFLWNNGKRVKLSNFLISIGFMPKKEVEEVYQSARASDNKDYVLSHELV